MPKVTIIDYGIGNILSVKRGFEVCEADIHITSDPAEIRKADYLVLPGVGAFADGMAGLRERHLIEPIREHTNSGRPFLGICLGMQMMLDESEEFGLHQGLGLIPGKVIAIDANDVDGVAQKVPHIGWNELRLPDGRDESWWSGTIMEGIPESETAYFVHSFTAVPSNLEFRLVDSYYGGRLISAAIVKGNIYGCQFHPEKSGSVGLKILRNFLAVR